MIEKHNAVEALGLMASSSMAAPQFDPNSIYADKGERSAEQPNNKYLFLFN
ncbi:TPA: hypothetical protein SMT55_002845 [Proteus mirabilis]|uniref:hypothetical protein n=1 Tax=Proteus mirabilis TaxID=584 RepID=UPI0029DFA6DF|nr:hypothetical protein [Proteus mirabilis]HEK1718506.1 hypothetical protein [Proteus mirabilis]HEK2725182.1 hypothetical protein [Proteus mirabilis]